MALSFDGGDDWVNLPTSSDMQLVQTLIGNEAGLVAYWTRVTSDAPVQPRACDSPVPTTAATWRQLAPAASPPGRDQSALVYDKHRRVAILIGGADSCADRQLRPDFTWEFDGATWRQVSTASTPPGRYHPAVAFDARRHRTVLFGGMSPPSSLADTWEYDGSDWVERVTTNSPGPCNAGAMSFDESRNVIVLYTSDGVANYCENPNTTWEYDGADWRLIETPTRPSTSGQIQRMMWSPDLGALVLVADGKAWSYNGNDYSLLHEFSCSDLPIALDESRGQFVGAAGGSATSSWSFAPTWEWGGVDDSLRNDLPSTPVPRALAYNAAVYFPPRGSVLLFGGFEYCTDVTYSDTWEYSLDSDGDGAADPIDCAPTDSSIYPGATEVCDGRPNDCLSPTWPALPAAEADADGDGNAICQGDCNDVDPSVQPEAIELCDDLDNDCDGTINEGNSGFDVDGDRVAGACDNCPNVVNLDQLDADRDGVGNACDNCMLTVNLDQIDTDVDGLGNACDNCVTSYNPSQADADKDLRGDVCDNCSTTRNESQHDLDTDGEGDECDLNDGVVLFRRISRPRLTWQTDPALTTFNVYRGSLPVLLATGAASQEPGSNPYAARFCELTTAYLDDPLAPLASEGLFWLITGKGASGESSLGAGDTVDRPNDFPCP